MQAASKQANIHMHMFNAATLVWGLLRLAPIIVLVHTLQFFSKDQNALIADS